MGRICVLAFALFAATLGTLAPATREPFTAGSPEPPLKIILLGVAGGPPATPGIAGISILIEANGEKLLFDCGRDTVNQLVTVGVNQRKIDKVFLTHLHSDHIISLPDILLTGWALGRKLPLRVWGPDGTKSMMDDLLKAFAFDIHMRRDVDEKFPGEGIRVVATDIREGVVYEHNGVKVTAFLVDHGPVKPAFGYRVDAGGHSVAMSGDTRFSENLIKHAAGVDVMIHETGPTVEQLTAKGFTAKQAKQIVNHHTPAAQAGVVFSRVNPRLGVFAHGGGRAAVAEASKTFKGPIEPGEDLLTITVGDKIEVSHHAASLER